MIFNLADGLLHRPNYIEGEIIYNNVLLLLI